jgi:Kef-type K+ transport system membrane component KefB
METLSIIFVLLIAARLFGAVAAKFNLPVLVGEIVAGVGIGIMFGWLGDEWDFFNVTGNHHFMALSDLGIFFLMLLGGIEMRPQELIESKFSSLLVAIIAMLVPFAGGFLLAWYWLPSSELHFAQSFFVGTALAITAVPVTIKVLMDMNMLNSRIGKLIVSAAVVDDLLSLILLSFLIAILNTGKLPEGLDILIILSKVFVFIATVSVLGIWIVKPVARFLNRLGLEEMDFSFLLILGTTFALIAEKLDLHFILGAFAAGLFFGQQTINEKVYNDVKKKVAAITTGFLAPIFFASIGIELDFSAVFETPYFLLSLIIMAFLGKLIGAAIPCLFLKYSLRESTAIGMAMSSRGAVELIIAGIALKAGLFESNITASPIIENLFSSIVIVAVVTTLLAPIGFRMLLARQT